MTTIRMPLAPCTSDEHDQCYKRVLIYDLNTTAECDCDCHDKDKP